MYFDMQINFRSMDFSICKSNFDLQIFRSANQISIYRFFDLQIKFRSTDCLICKSYFDLQIFRSANQVSIYRFFDLQIKFRSKDFSICTMYYDKIFAIFPKMNLKFTIPQFFDIFGHHHPDNQGLTIHIYPQLRHRSNFLNLTFRHIQIKI